MGSCAAPSAKGDDKFITTDYLQQCQIKLLHFFGSHAVAIEHIGSTAIPNQRAKPVIDIFIGVSPFAELPFISAFLMQRSITTLRQI
ncbi:GrpB family protein [Escherichia coli]|uniref:GrpB family protein n=1 Tax=Escherichia coli TaxID=562 RepID=UPI0033156D76